MRGSARSEAAAYWRLAPPKVANESFWAAQEGKWLTLEKHTIPGTSKMQLAKHGFQGYVNGGVVSKRWFELCPEIEFRYPLFTSI